LFSFSCLGAAREDPIVPDEEAVTGAVAGGLVEVVDSAVAEEALAAAVLQGNGNMIGNLFVSTKDFENLSSIITEAEKGHIGEIVVYLRNRAPLFTKKTIREDALEQFSVRGVWDTEENVGVLIFICLGKKAIEIVVDRGASKKIPSDIWNTICGEAVEIFRNERNYQVGIEHAIKRVGEELRKALPGEREKNQIPDTIITG